MRRIMMRIVLCFAMMLFMTACSRTDDVRHPARSPRMEALKAVRVEFDAGGGYCPDAVRYVKEGGYYGSNMNLYPSEDRRNFINHNHLDIDPEDGLLAVALENKGTGDLFANYFTSPVLPQTPKGQSWTYAVDVAYMKGCLADWVIGQSWDTNHNVYAQLSVARIGTNVLSGIKIFKVLKTVGWNHYNMLDRAYLYAKPGQSFAIEFRVSLFAGTSVNEGNYHYVKPGETVTAVLPEPAWKGHRFLGWYDGDRRIREGTIVDKNWDHTLKARWSKD